MMTRNSRIRSMRELLLEVGLALGASVLLAASATAVGQRTTLTATVTVVGNIDVELCDPEDFDPDDPTACLRIGTSDGSSYQVSYEGGASRSERGVIAPRYTLSVTLIRGTSNVSTAQGTASGPPTITVEF